MTAPAYADTILPICNNASQICAVNPLVQGKIYYDVNRENGSGEDQHQPKHFETSKRIEIVYQEEEYQKVFQKMGVDVVEGVGVVDSEEQTYYSPNNKHEKQCCQGRFEGKSRLFQQEQRR